MFLNFAVIGCGAIGRKRASALASERIVACVDTDIDRAQALCRDHPGSEAFQDPLKVIDHRDVEAVVIATPHVALAQLVEEAVRRGKHVLVEKPAARRASELGRAIELAKANHVKVHVGFNHRYHRAFRKAKLLVDSGKLGPLMFVRARYGHGGRLGYEKEWRAKPALSGGGELIDQGVHLIDLARWFLGDFPEVQGHAMTYFWDMPVDDNAFLLLRTNEKRTAFLHASCTEWKNTFSFEVYGREGKLHIEGLGGSYGTERLTWYRMLPQMGPPDTTIWEFPMNDDSWECETSEFIEDIKLDRTPASSLNDAVAALAIVEEIYRRSGYDHHA
jgi:predicted dehydrogenase